MADSKSTLTLTVKEIGALADRLEARAASVLMRDQPQLCADMQQAARLLRFLICSGAVQQSAVVGPAPIRPPR
jgi:hypothetical protein